MYKIASALEYGPKLKNLFGFDIICFKNSVQFSMQLCKTQPSTKFQKFQSDLIKGMKIMHSLKIVHQDIKTENISWSPTFKKWVFLDFGFSSSIQERPGQKTFTCYRGTYNFVLKQMKNLCHSKSFGFVDLYANDLYGLKVSQKKSVQKKVNLVKNESSIQFFYFCNMRFYIANRNYKQLHKILQLHLNLKEECLNLLIIEIERNKFNNVQKSSELLINYENLKSILDTKIRSDQRQKKKKSEEDRKYFKMFIQQEQSQKSMFLFLEEQKLKKILIQRWKSFSFIKQIFMFFQETLYQNSEVSWSRMKFITNVLIKILDHKLLKKTWLLKFCYLLNIFQQKFLEKKQFNHLKQIFYCYYFFGYRTKYQQLNNILLQNLAEQENILNHFCKLYGKIAMFRSVDVCRKLLGDLKQNVKEFSQKLTLLPILFRLAELMLIQQKMEQNEKMQFQKLFKLLNLQNFLKKSSFLDLIIKVIEEWKTSPLQTNSFEKQMHEEQVSISDLFRYNLIF